MSMSPPPPPQPPQPVPISYATQPPVDADASHLSLLATFHIIWACLLGVFSCCPAFNIVLGVLMVNGTMQQLAMPRPGTVVATPPPAFNPAGGWIQIVMGVILCLAGWTIAVLTLVSARSIRRRRDWTFSIVVASLNCAIVPFGTVLGVFTLIVLLRDSVRAVYAHLPKALPIDG